MHDRHQQIKENLSNYRWLKSECIRLGKEIHSQQSGDEKETNEGLGGLSNVSKVSKRPKVMASKQATIRRLNERYLRHKEAAETIERIADNIQVDKHWVVFDCRLSGMTMQGIAEHIGLSRNTIRLILDNVINEHLEKEYNKV